MREGQEQAGEARTSGAFPGICSPAWQVGRYLVFPAVSSCHPGSLGLQEGLPCVSHIWEMVPASSGRMGGEVSPVHLTESILRLCCPGTQPCVFCALHRLQNETAANEVLASIQNYFKSQPFDFRGAQIISGQEEGIYGWITANYLMGNFLEVCENKCMVSNLAIDPFPCGW